MSVANVHLLFGRNNSKRVSTGSERFDSILGGGLPKSCITDVFGAAGTGKTQFAFQNAVMTAVQNPLQKLTMTNPSVVFIDCAGSFRPERIVEISDARSLDASVILDSIFSISVRTVKDQTNATERVISDELFLNCKLLVVDDVTSNFVSDFDGEDHIVERQRILALYARNLAYLAGLKGLSVLLTNSVRARGDLGEGETTGEVLSAFSFARLHFNKRGQRREARVLHPRLINSRINFQIGAYGIS